MNIIYIVNMPRFPMFWPNASKLSSKEMLLAIWSNIAQRRPRVEIMEVVGGKKPTPP